MTIPREPPNNIHYRFWIWPRPEASFPPRRWWHWWRLTLVLAVVALGVSFGPWLAPRLSCRDGLPAEAIWSDAGECVGVSDGGYAFDLDPQFGAALAKIDEQNRKVRARQTACSPDVAPVTVGVLSSMTSADAEGRAPHEIEGYAAAQANANGPGCIYPVLLKVGNIGADAQAAVPVAQLLKADPDVVAVVGGGISHTRSAEAADLLGLPEPEKPATPLVAGLITAEGFDRDGSKTDNPDYSGCEDPRYQRGVGGGYFYRISYRNAVQVGVLGDYLGRRPDFIVTPTDKRDPYTCTALPFVQRQNYRQAAAGGLAEVRFDPTDEPTVQQAAERICRESGPVTAFYTARSRDLARFIASIDAAYSNGLCRASSITVASTSDAVRLLAREPQSGLEGLRRQALSSPAFQNGTLRLVYTPLADAVSLRGTSRFAELQRRFSEFGFQDTHVDDGWAVNAYDSLLVVSEALRGLHTKSKPTRGQVNGAISAFSPGYGRLGAGGLIAFDNANNRDGKPALVRLCPGKAGAGPSTVRVEGRSIADGSVCRN